MAEYTKQNSKQQYITLYNEDQKWLFKYNQMLVDLIALSDNDILAEVGCGTGILGGAIAGKVKKYIGIDLSFRMLEAFQKALSQTNTYIVNCDATNAWPFKVEFNKVIFSINTIREFTPASTQIKLLRDISRNYLVPSATICIIFNNYFKWMTLREILSLEYEKVLFVNDVAWKAHGKYFINNQMNTHHGANDVVCELEFINEFDQIVHRFPLTWEPLDFYISALDKMGFLCNVFGDFSGSPYNSNLSDFAIIKAVRG